MLTDILQRWRREFNDTWTWYYEQYYQGQIYDVRKVPFRNLPKANDFLTVLVAFGSFACGFAMLVMYAVFKDANKICRGANKPAKGCTTLNATLIMEGVVFVGLGLVWLIFVIFVLVKTKPMDKVLRSEIAERSRGHRHVGESANIDRYTNH